MAVRSILIPAPVNGPFDDPGVYVRVAGERNALLLDLGDISRLTPSQVLRVSDVFISHTHIDHFIGFDQLLRIFLGRERRIRFFGPRGLIRQVRGKLAGYTWNLVEDYRLELEVGELAGGRLRKRLFTCRRRFRHSEDLGEIETAGLVHETPLYRVRAAVLDHRTPCLAWLLEEKVRLSVHKERVESLGLTVGPWLTAMKAGYIGGQGDRVMELPVAGGTRGFSVRELVERVTTASPGRKIGYVTDIVWSPSNVKKAVELVQGCDILYCEAVFLERDAERALLTRHLTAAQAGELAARAGAGRLEIFHFSPRYQDEAEALRREAETHFRGDGQPRPGRD